MESASEASPFANPPGTTLPDWLLRIRSVPLILLLAAFVLLDILTATIWEINGDEIAGIFVGCVFAQAVLSATFTSLSAAPLGIRASVGILTAGLIGLLMFRVALRDAGDTWTAYTLTAAVLIQWAVCQLPLLVARSYGWRIANSQHRESVNSLEREESQFGIRQLLAWTLVAAILLGVAKTIIVSENNRVGDLDRSVILMFVSLCLFTPVASLAAIWTAFARKGIFYWMLGSCGLMFGLAAIHKIQIPSSDDFVYMLYACLGAISFVSLLLARLAGFRLLCK